MEFINVEEPELGKPIIIAAMQDMANVANIVVDLINKNLKTQLFRYVSIPYPDFVTDKGGYVDFQQQRWEYRYGDGLIIFGGGAGQPQTNTELYDLCRDVVGICKTYSVQLIYTLGAFHTTRKIGKEPKTFFAATSKELAERIKKVGVEATPGSSVITGFNGLILGLAKMNDIQGIGLYGEINDPRISQYRTAKNVLQTLERLTYMKFGELSELDVMADAVDEEMSKMKESGHSYYDIT